MYTIEATYVFTIVFLVIAFIINGTIKMENKVVVFAEEWIQTELNGHTEGNEKMYQPEAFVRGATLFEQDKDPADREG